MKPVTKEILKESANKLMFDLSDEQLDTLLKEFDVILKQMDLIGDIKGVDTAEPMTFPFEVTVDYLRDDVSENQITREEALKNSGDVVEGQIRLPKVVI